MPNLARQCALFGCNPFAEAVTACAPGESLVDCRWRHRETACRAPAGVQRYIIQCSTSVGATHASPLHMCCPVSPPEGGGFRIRPYSVTYRGRASTVVRGLLKYCSTDARALGSGVYNDATRASLACLLLTIIHGAAIIAATINLERRSATVRRGLFLWVSLTTS